MDGRGNEMKRIIAVFTLLLLATFAVGQSSQPRNHLPKTTTSSTKPTGTGSKSTSTVVHGYTTSKGTTVQPYHRTTPDSTQMNNYSTRGNYDPYTGKTGTKPPTH
jgi:hypothetical protein